MAIAERLSMRGLRVASCGVWGVGLEGTAQAEHLGMGYGAQRRTHGTRYQMEI